MSSGAMRILRITDAYQKVRRYPLKPAFRRSIRAELQEGEVADFGLAVGIEDKVHVVYAIDLTHRLGQRIVFGAFTG